MSAAVKVCLWIVLISCVQALQLECIESLPSFVDQGDHSPRLLVGVQTLVPAYQFSCHGKVTRWGIATVRQGKHSINLQVWRPTKRYGSDVYSLVGSNIFDIEPPIDRKLLYVSPPTLDQITVQPGDMIGFYLQNNISIEDNFSIQYKPYAHNVTVHYVMTDEPLTVIEETTLSIQMSKTAPIITVDIDFLGSAVKSPITTIPFSSPTQMYKSTGISNSILLEYTISDSTQFLPTEETTSSTIPTAAILGVALGILIIAVMLAVIGVAIICKKTGSSTTSEDRVCQTHTTCKRNKQTTLRAICTRNTEQTCITEFLIKENPAYSQGTCSPLQTCTSNQAHEYETPVVFKTDETSPGTNHEYDIPRHANSYKHHDYEEVLD